jgi:UDP-N-acetylglucosamine 1-carboxyvinyltransferase
MDDQIEAGTYAIAGIMAGDDVTVAGMNPQWNFAVLDTFTRLGVRYDEGSNWVRVYGDGELKPTEIITAPYPGFPTDMQAQMMALMTIVPGLSTVTERIYPERFMHVPELIRLGADVKIEGAMAIVNGVKSLSGAYVMANDLRASAALVLAGLIAEGETHVRRIYHLDRGYEQLEQKFTALGARITRVDEDEEAG